jgi:hypothetical protein
MALASLRRVKKRAIQILNANRGAYSDFVGTGANRTGAYPFDDELTDAALEADGLVITEAYFQTDNLRSRFLETSGNLDSGANLEDFTGRIGKAQWSTNGNDWQDSELAKTKADVTQAVKLGDYVSATAFQGLHFFAEGCVFHTSPYFRFQYPFYSRRTILQAWDYHEPAIIAGMLKLLYKDSSVYNAEYYSKIFDASLARIIAGATNLPEVPMISG